MEEGEGRNLISHLTFHISHFTFLTPHSSLHTPHSTNIVIVENEDNETRVERECGVSGAVAHPVHSTGIHRLCQGPAGGA